MGVGILGAGYYGAVHAELVTSRTDVQLVGIGSRTMASARPLASRFGVEALSAEDLVNRDDVELVVIATPHYAHVENALLALRAGKHVLLEKPIAASSAESQIIRIEASRAAGICFLGHPMRWSSSYADARALIASGEIGDVVEIESASQIPWKPSERSPWHRSQQLGGGIWLTQGVHVLDRISWLAGAQATHVSGFAQTRFNNPATHTADDYGVAMLSFPNLRAIARLAGHNSRLSDIETRVLGTAGQMRISHHGRLLVVVGEQVLVDRPDNVGWRDQMMSAEWDSFIDSARRGKASVDADYGSYIVEIVDAIRRSKGSLLPVTSLGVKERAT